MRIWVLVVALLMLCGCGKVEEGPRFTSGQCVNCGEVTERAVEYEGLIFCEYCYQGVLPTICDICGQNADAGEDHNGILYCEGCFEEYCDENDVRRCANCNEFKKECTNRGSQEIPVWVCKDCGTDDKFDPDNTVEETIK